MLPNLAVSASPYVQQPASVKAEATLADTALVEMVDLSLEGEAVWQPSRAPDDASGQRMQPPLLTAISLGPPSH